MAKKTVPNSADLRTKKSIPRGTILHYVDEMFGIEREALAVTNLLIGVLDQEVLDQQTISEVGTMIKNYFDRQRILRHHFFGEKLGHVADDLVAGEIARLENKYRKEDESEDSGSSTSDQ